MGRPGLLTLRFNPQQEQTGIIKKDPLLEKSPLFHV